jgi:uncharacterized protein (TIGR03435 family)
MRRRRTAAAVLIAIRALTTVGLAGQQQYEAAAVKTSPPRDLVEVVPGVFQPNGQWTARSATLSVLLRSAYDLPSKRISGDLPSWVFTDRFDITTTSAPDQSPQDLQQMAQALLADRFGVRTHWEQQDTEVFALVRIPDVPLGPGLRPSPAGCGDRSHGSASLPAGDPCKEAITKPDDDVFRLELRDRPLQNFLTISGARQEIGDPVVDRTGLTGNFDIDIEYAVLSFGRRPPTGSVPLGIAVVEQLGLRFEQRTEAADVLVVDQVTRPSTD